MKKIMNRIISNISIDEEYIALLEELVSSLQNLETLNLTLKFFDFK